MERRREFRLLTFGPMSRFGMSSAAELLQPLPPVINSVTDLIAKVTALLTVRRRQLAGVKAMKLIDRQRDRG
jgi:hypothetical protein